MPTSTCSIRRRGWSRVDELELDWIEARRFPWLRAFVLDDDVVELLLVSATGAAGTRGSAATARLPGRRLLDERPHRGRERRGTRRAPGLVPARGVTGSEPVPGVWHRVPGTGLRLTCAAHGAELETAAGRRRGAAGATRRQRGFFGRLRDSLGKSRRALTEQLRRSAFDPADDASWERLEEALLYADVGVRATAELDPPARGAAGPDRARTRRSPRRSRRSSASRRRSTSRTRPR